MKNTTSLHPMSDFDPRRSAYLYDSLNEHWLRWRPEYAERWREARKEKRGVVNFDGMLFEGWLEIEEGDAAEIAGPRCGGGQRQCADDTIISPHAKPPIEAPIKE